ncbi:MAG: hypothetical protein IIA14_04325 [SAR324 cluster bacterium]|nr:hypothetical protein [SAR324 cluster bacterium]
MGGYAMHLQPDLAVSYYGILTVTTEPRLETVEMRNGVGALWPYLSDPERKLLRELDLVDESEHRYGPVFIPTTFVLDAERTIYSVYNGWWFVGRPTVEEIRQDMRAIFSKREDWEYRKEWTAGGIGKPPGSS